MSGVWRKANLLKRRDYNRKWFDANVEKDHAHRAEYRKANKNKESRRTRAWAVANRERKRALDAAWPKNNPLANVLRTRRRRARQIDASGRGVTATEWQEVIANALGLCAYCNRSKSLTMDHVEPLSGGGAHDVMNVVAACKSCNSSKGDNPLLVWLTYRAALRSAA